MTGTIDRRTGGVLGAKTRLLSLAGLLLVGVTACSQPPPPVTAAPRTPAVCEALRPAMPISYSGSRDTPETVKGVRQANARFAAACP